MFSICNINTERALQIVGIIMKNSSYFIKLLTISACFFVAQPVQTMVQNALDYIQTYRKPIEKSVDYLLLIPRLLISDIEEAKKEGFYRRATALTALMQSLAPGAYAMHLASDPDSMELAIEKGKVGLVRGLITHGYDVNKENGKALKLAIFYIHPEIVKLLLEAGANVNFDMTNPLGKEKTRYIMGMALGYFPQLPTDTPETTAKILEIQKILEEHKAKYAKQAQEAIETHATAPAEYRGSKEIAGIIKGYL